MGFQCNPCDPKWHRWPHEQYIVGQPLTYTIGGAWVWAPYGCLLGWAHPRIAGFAGTALLIVELVSLLIALHHMCTSCGNACLWVNVCMRVQMLPMSKLTFKLHYLKYSYPRYILVKQLCYTLLQHLVEWLILHSEINLDCTGWCHSTLCCLWRRTLWCSGHSPQSWSWYPPGNKGGWTTIPCIARVL